MTLPIVILLRERARQAVNYGPNRKKDRSRTYKGIAEAMAEQWGWLNIERKAA